MLTNKLLAAVGLASALLLGVAGSAEARGWGGGERFHRGPVFCGPIYRGPVYGGPAYVAPPAYGAGWRRGAWRYAEWRREHHRIGRRY